MLKVHTLSLLPERDASEDNYVDKETDRLLPLHVSWCHSSMKYRCMNYKTV